MNSEALCSHFHQLPDPVDHLLRRHAVFGISGISHKAVPYSEFTARVIPETNFLGDSAVLRQKINMGKIIEINNRIQPPRIFKVRGRRRIGGKHDVLSVKAQAFRKHQLRIRGAVRPAALFL